jgi:hypothetical protein
MFITPQFLHCDLRFKLWFVLSTLSQFSRLALMVSSGRIKVNTWLQPEQDLWYFGVIPHSTTYVLIEQKPNNYLPIELCPYAIPFFNPSRENSKRSTSKWYHWSNVSQTFLRSSFNALKSSNFCRTWSSEGRFSRRVLCCFTIMLSTDSIIFLRLFSPISIVIIPFNLSALIILIKFFHFRPLIFTKSNNKV